MKKFAIVISTSGSVLGKVLEADFFCNKVDLVISDRQCKGIDVAKRFGIETVVIERGNQAFCDELTQVLVDREIDYVVSFYTKLFVGDFLTIFSNRIINLHPSILPAYPGLRGFEDSVDHGALLLGSTIHFVDQGMDTGLPIIHALVANDPRLSTGELRHRVFVGQCYSLLQVVKWLCEDRIHIVDDRVVVGDAQYEAGEYIPKIESSVFDMVFVDPQWNAGS